MWVVETTTQFSTRAHSPLQARSHRGSKPQSGQVWCSLTVVVLVLPLDELAELCVVGCFSEGKWIVSISTTIRLRRRIEFSRSLLSCHDSSRVNIPDGIH